ncbi:nucleotide exchange factor GrpE [Candidatus Nitrosotenuis cloacae]|uniref:Protein GrpE n=1 Tax=Candidatus Nitrosotenuis cloacae TaxID=1603555 RepID=A0A3G1B1V4_9ARCH|nr:nucleotide exchange factor GrpE [Candidatus Nitrosotenuis cloacae]AJZ76116.1 molecular chaperone GrpE [Candidatus Nitrosotenuis cloacae]
MSEQNEAEDQNISEDVPVDESKQLRQSLASCEDKLKRSLADYINLERKTKSDIQNGINEKMDRFLLQFLTIYDDLIRAKEILKKENPDAQGLDAILKNIDSLLSGYGVTPINAIGEIFDPSLHEAIAIISDDSLDDNTITKELRKGYISHNRTLRPTLVEISKKS